MCFNALAGWLKDVSGTFSLPFLVCGLMQASGGLILFAIGVVRSYRGASRSPIHRPAAQSEKENGR